MVEAIKVIALLRPIVQPSATSETFASLYVMALSGELGTSPLLREALLHLKKVSSETLQRIFEALSKEPTTFGTVRVAAHQSSLHDLLTSAVSSGPLRSQHDIRTATLRTTVVSQKIELSKQKSSLSKHDAAYSDLLETFHDELQDYFSSTLTPLEDIVFHEIFLYDVKSLQSDAFTSRPRYVVERALYAPSDYLNCKCCTNTEKDEADEVTILLSILELESATNRNGDANSCRRLDQSVTNRQRPYCTSCTWNPVRS
jgi:origin recognition complex subunit 3